MANRKATRQKSGEGIDADYEDEKATEGAEGTEEESGEGSDDEGEDEFLNAPPKGMVRRNAVEQAGWVAKAKGFIVYGVLLGRYARNDKNEEGKIQHFYQLKLLQPCMVMLPADKQTEEVSTKEVPKGSVVNLDENKGVEGLAEALKEGGTQVAWIKFVGKKAQQKNRSRKFWEIECYTEKRSAPF